MMEERRRNSQFNFMMDNLHEMLRLMGEQRVGSITIKLDEFEKLRVNFTSLAEKYQQSTAKLDKTSDHMQRVNLRSQIGQCKYEMDSSLKQMVAIVTKLNEKIKRKNQPNQEQQNKLQQQIQYKNLTIYGCQKIYFKLIKKEKRMPTVRQMKEKYLTLEQIKERGEALWEKEEEEDIEEKQLLEALKHIDDMIEEKMDDILQGIDIMHRNAINISQTINIVHRKILVNLDKVHQNKQVLKDNQQRIQQASKHLTKPSCIVNVIICLLLGVIIYLIVTIFITDKQESDTLNP